METPFILVSSSFFKSKTATQTGEDLRMENGDITCRFTSRRMAGRNFRSIIEWRSQQIKIYSLSRFATVGLPASNLYFSCHFLFPNPGTNPLAAKKSQHHKRIGVKLKTHPEQITIGYHHGDGQVDK